MFVSDARPATAGHALWQLTDAQIADEVAGAQRARTAADVRLVLAAAAGDQRGLARAAGFTSTTAWLASVAGITKPEAARFVSLARLDVDCHQTRQAWAAGELSTTQAGIILRSIDALPDWCDDEPTAAAEKVMLEHAKTLNADDLRRLGNKILEYIDPDGADEALAQQLEREEQRAHDRASLRFSRPVDGIVKLRGQLPTVQAAMLRTALEAISSPRRTPVENQTEGKNDVRLRPHDERLGQALCALAEHLPVDKLPQAGGVSAVVAITIDWETLRSNLGTATLSTGDPISAGQARRLACNTGLLPVVLDTTSRVLDYGQARRLHSAAQRYAIAARDRGCAFAGCDRPPAWCEVHHATPFSEGGDTSIENGVLFCTIHHHLIHEDWDLQRSPDDGVWEVIPPARIDPLRRPRRHARYGITAPPPT